MAIALRLPIQILYYLYLAFFFFKAEEGIRDADVTGVQTCALPISAAGAPVGNRARAAGKRASRRAPRRQRAVPDDGQGKPAATADRADRPDRAHLSHDRLLRRPPRRPRSARRWQGAAGVR